MQRHCPTFFLTCLLRMLVAIVGPTAVAFGSSVDQDAIAIIEKRCVQCHNQEDRAGGLSLADRQAMLAGGESGPIIDSDQIEQSMILQQIQPMRGRAEMPKSSSPLSDAEIELIRRWLIDGAPWPTDRAIRAPKERGREWWSFQPLRNSPLPHPAPPRSPSANFIDQHIQHQLQQHGLALSPRADPRTLVRRAYFDLWGLPPSEEEIEAFEQSAAPDRWEQLIDRLLASPRYGERWARHWLDVVHFADSHGYDKDKPRDDAWPYRDYVIRSFNADKPWSQFVREQIAGDILAHDPVDGCEALGFLSAGPWDFIGHEELPESKIDGKMARHLDRDDMVRTTIQSFMSLTVGCAQCHNHKFDPIRQEEYYQLQAVFAAIDRTTRTYDRDAQRSAQRIAVMHRIEALRNAMESTEETTHDEALIEHRMALLSQLESELASLTPQDRVYVGAVHHGAGNFIGTGAQEGRPRPIFILERGEVTRPGKEVQPGCLAIDGVTPPRFVLPLEHTEADRRVALADWIASEENAFTWRSIVNRIWHYHFGRGLVSTPDDFGRMGSPPSHPELLDLLAYRFRDSGQSLKTLHRWMMTSETYQQSSLVQPDDRMHQRAREIDPDNRWLWKANRRKRDAEAIRDSVLAVSGQLDLRMGGPGYRDFVVERPEHSPHYRYDLADPKAPEIHRRAVYRFVVRSQLQPFMNNLDCADPSIQMGVRNQGNSPIQALTLWNNAFMLAASEAMANRLAQEHSTIEEQVEMGFRETLGRTPTSEEGRLLREHAERFGLADVCRIFWNLNEFILID